jgi:hypothetical protein
MLNFDDLHAVRQEVADELDAHLESGALENFLGRFDIDHEAYLEFIQEGAFAAMMMQGGPLAPPMIMAVMTASFQIGLVIGARTADTSFESDVLRGLDDLPTTDG